MKSYCWDCDKDVVVTIKEEYQTNVIKGEKVISLLKCAYCGDCGEEIYVPSIGDENLNRIEASCRADGNGDV